MWLAGLNNRSSVFRGEANELSNERTEVLTESLKDRQPSIRAKNLYSSSHTNFLSKLGKEDDGVNILFLFHICMASLGNPYIKPRLLVQAKRSPFPTPPPRVSMGMRLLATFCSSLSRLVPSMHLPWDVTMLYVMPITLGPGTVDQIPVPRTNFRPMTTHVEDDIQR